MVAAMGWRVGIRYACAAVCVVVGVTAPGTARAAAGFAPAETLPATGAASFGVKTAIAPNGFAIAGWVEALSGGQSAIRVATRLPGGPWSAAQQLDVTSLTQTLYPPSVAIDSAGDAAVAWDDTQLGSPTIDTAAVATKPAGQTTFGAVQKLTGAVDPVVGIDSTGHVTMIDEEGGSNDEVDRVWPATGTAPASRSDLLTTNCHPDLVHSVLAVAPSGNAILGANCNGDTFIRRISGAWKPGSTPISDFSNPGNCAAFIQPSGSHGQGMSVAIDSAGDVAGAFVQDSYTQDCTTFMQSDTYSLNLVLGGGTGVGLVTPAVDTATSFGVVTGSSISGPAVAVAPDTELVAWRNGNLISTSLKARFFDAAGIATFAPETFVTMQFGADPQVAMNANGSALAVFPTADGNGLQAAARPPGMPGFLQSVPLAAAASNASVAIDDAGDGLAAYGSGPSTSAVAQIRGFDANPPSLGAATIPATATAGTPATFTAQGSDVWGPVTLSWDFGDGSSLVTGASVMHTFAKAGSYTVAVTATDAVGNAVSKSGSIAVEASTPVLSKVSIKPKRFKAGHKAVFTFTLNEPAKVSVTVTPRKHRPHGKHHAKAAGKLTSRGVSGVNHVPFTGRIGRHLLAPGPYRATIVAADGSVKSKPATVSFTILPAG
jgi:PKD repeat protein